MNDVIDIKNYKSFNLINFKKIYSFTTIILFLLICLFVVLLFYFDFHLYTKATYIKENDTLKILCSEDDLSKITDNDTLLIKDKEYEYKIRSIDKKILESVPLQQYNEILISLKLDEKYKLENNSIDLKIKYDHKQLFEIIKNFILGKGK